MLETLNNWVISANDWIWTYLLIILLILIGLYFTFKSRFVQFRYFGEMFRLLGQGVSNGKGKKFRFFVPGFLYSDRLPGRNG